MAVNSILNSDNVSNVYGTLKDKTNNIDEKQVSFSDFLNNAVNQVNQLQIDSEKLGNDLAAGKTDNIHQVLIAAEKAEIALQFTMQIRNKIMDAYSEIMRMQI